MRIRFVLVLSLLAMNGLAFDSEAWLQKRALLGEEADRLKAAFATCAAKAKAVEPAQDIAVPIETFPDGSVKTMIHAARAIFFASSGLIWAEDVSVEKKDSDGKETGRIEATSCVIDRYTKSGWAEGAASITFGKTRFSGADVYFSSPEGFVSVRRDSRVESKDLKFGEVTP